MTPGTRETAAFALVSLQSLCTKVIFKKPPSHIHTTPMEGGQAVFRAPEPVSSPQRGAKCTGMMLAPGNQGEGVVATEASLLTLFLLWDSGPSSPPGG